MFCKYCGCEIGEDSKFCPCCGKKLIEEKKYTFKDGIKALFNKFFLFNGRSSRSEFNYGLLFAIIICVAISFVCILFSNGFWNYFNEFETYFFTLLDSENVEALATPELVFEPWDAYMIGSLIVEVVEGVLLIGPFYRRIYDIYLSEKRAKIYTIILASDYVISVLTILLSNTSSPALYAITNILNYVSIVTSIMALIYLFRCIFKPSNPMQEIFDAEITDENEKMQD